jgi:hypothetical protein
MTPRDSMVPFRVFGLFRSLGYIFGIEICYDRLTRFVDKLLNSIDGIAADIDGVTDYDLDFSRLQGKTPLNMPATMTGIPRITVAIVAQKPSHAIHIALNIDFMA